MIDSVDGQPPRTIEATDKTDPVTEVIHAPIAGQVFRGSWITVAAQAAQLVLRLASTVVLARLLTRDDYGLVAMVTVLTGFIALFRSLGLGTATVQAPRVTDRQLNAVFWINVALGAAATAITVAAAPLMAAFYGEPRVMGLAIGLSASFLIGGFGVQHSALLRRHMRFPTSAAIEVFSAVVGTVVAIACAWTGAGPWSLVWGFVATEITHVALVWTAVKWRPGAPTFQAQIEEMVGLGKDVTQFNVLNYWARNLDNFLIGRFWGAAQLGLYSRAYQLLLLPLQQITSPLATVAIPALSRLNGENTRFRNAYTRLLEKVAMACMPLTMFLFVEADLVIDVVLGPRWADVVPIFAPLAGAGMVQPVMATLMWVIISQGRRPDLRHWSVISPALSCAAIVAGLPWGSVGVARTYAASEIAVRAPLLVWFVTRHGPVGARDVVRAIAPGLIASGSVWVACTVLSAFVPLRGLMGLLLATMTALAAMAVSLVALPSGRRACRDIVNLMSKTNGSPDSAEALLFQKR